MSQLLINEYLKQLDVIKTVSGSSRETIVREAFKDLLNAWGGSTTSSFGAVQSEGHDEKQYPI